MSKFVAWKYACLSLVALGGLMQRVVLIVAGVVLVPTLALATPSTTYWAPSTANCQAKGVPHFNAGRKHGYELAAEKERIRRYSAEYKSVHDVAETFSSLVLCPANPIVSRRETKDGVTQTEKAD